MSNDNFDFGMIGLGVMGYNFAMNVVDNGFSVLGLVRTDEKAATIKQQANHPSFDATSLTRDFVDRLSAPRRIMLLVPAGDVVDQVIESLLPFLQPGDLIMDGGNSYFADTERRIAALDDKQIMYLGVGVSGGEEGARRGPSIMPGGNQQAWEKVRPILEAVSAKVDGQPCVDFMGNGSAGNYVKMVHNGIEYAMMQLLAEAYDVLKRVGGLSNQELHETFARWNGGFLKSFLVEITAEIFAQADDLEPGDLIDKVLDKAKQKGTGKWTSQHAMDLGVPTPTIDAAVTMRGISSFKDQREMAEGLFDSAALFETAGAKVDKQELIDQVGQALWFGFLVSYSQGLTLLAEASAEKGYELNLETCAKIWRGGCIIRADMLEDIRRAFSEDANLTSLLWSPVFRERIVETQAGCRRVLQYAARHGVPALALGSALHYFDAFRTGRLPLNLVQAQRDFFGAHTFERIDRPGSFHTDWSSWRNDVAQ